MCVCQALVRTLNQQSFKSSSSSSSHLSDTGLCQLSLPTAAGGGPASSCASLSDGPHQSLLDLNNPGYFMIPRHSSSSYLSPTGSMATTGALRDLQAFASHTATQSPDTTDQDSSGVQDNSSIQDNSGIEDSSGAGQSLVGVDDCSRRARTESSSSVCTTCGRGCGCHKRFDDTRTSGECMCVSS